MRRFLLATAAVSLLTLAAAAIARLGASLDANEAFLWQFGAQDGRGAVLILVLLVVAALAPARWGPAVERAVVAVGARPWWVAAVGAAALAVLCLLVFDARPLTGADEYLPFFQAEIFAAGEVTGRWPVELVPWLLPTRLAELFYRVGPAGQVVSVYWPGFALLLTPFVGIGWGGLLNPLLAGGSLALLIALARRLYPANAAAPGWAALFAVASPAFVLNAASFYSMNAHLCANLLFAWLLSVPTRRRAALAGAVGSLALALHNPLPHTLFAAPWLAWTALRRERRRLLLPLAAGYLPLTLLLVVGWPLLCRWLDVHGPVQPPALALPFGLPRGELLWIRLLELLRLFAWAVPGLPLLAGWGVALLRRRAGPLQRELAVLLAASALATLAGYFLLALDQGWGWGYRHFHYAWGTLALLAPAPLVFAAPARRVAGVGLLVVGSLVAGNGLRLWQAATVVRQDVATHAPPPPASPAVCFVTARYNLHQLRNDPFLREPVWMLGSRGAAQDGELLRRRFPGAHRLPGPPGITCWAVGEAELQRLRAPAG